MVVPMSIFDRFSRRDGGHDASSAGLNVERVAGTLAVSVLAVEDPWESDAGGHSKRLSESQGRRAPAKKVPPTSLAEAMINDTEASVMANFDFLAQEGVGIEVDDDDDDLSDDMDDGTDDDNEDQTAAKRSKTKNKVDI